MNVGDQVRVRGEKGVWEVRRVFAGGLVYIRMGPNAQAIHPDRLKPARRNRRKRTQEAPGGQATTHPNPGHGENTTGRENA